MPSRKKESASGSTAIRLQRFLAQAGYGSRRECEELITEGRVTVDSNVVNQLGSRVEADCLTVRVDGTKVVPNRLQYFLVHKPTGVLSTCRDPEGRMRVIDLIKTDQRVYNVGRLDKSSEGLILVTNDGDLANRLTHPRYGVQKTYHVSVAGNPKWEDLQMLKRGIRLAEAVARVSDVKVRKRRKDSCDLVIVLEEGRNREIRRLLAHIGHKVTRLRRVAIGPVQLGNLKAGDYRRLEPRELEALQKASSQVRGKRARKSRPVETSQLGGWKKKSSGKKKTVKKKTARKKVGKKKQVSKKKRPAKSESRRGANRHKKVVGKKKSTRSKPGKKKSGRRTTLKRGIGKKKTARTRKGSGSRR